MEDLEQDLSEAINEAIDAVGRGDPQDEIIAKFEKVGDLAFKAAFGSVVLGYEENLENHQ